MNKADDIERLRLDIEAAYRKSGNDLGWRFLASPAQVLEGADIAFIGLNPGGAVRPADHAEFCMAGGSAYVDEQWGPRHAAGSHPLQRQVRALFAGLDVQPHRVLAGNLVPFRSPSWAALNEPAFAVGFGQNLWRKVIAAAAPSLIIAMGSVTFRALHDALDAGPVSRLPVGWGNVCASRARFGAGTLVGLPHLSRFAIITRPASAPALRALFEPHWAR